MYNQKALLVLAIMGIILVSGCIQTAQEKESIQKEVAENMTSIVQNTMRDTIKPFRTISINSVFEKDNLVNVKIENTGTIDISSKNLIKAHVGGVPVKSSGCDSLNSGEICTLELTETPFPDEGTTTEIIVTIDESKAAEYVCKVKNKGHC